MIDMTSLEIEPPRIHLCEGPEVSEAAIDVLLALANKGIMGTVDSGHRLTFAGRMTADDWRAVREWESDIRTCLAYIEAL